MPVFFLKSLLSVLTLALTFIAMFTMFEVLGRSEKRYNVETLKKIHRANGILYILLFIFIAYFCIVFILNTRAEPSPRAAFHAVFALAVIALLTLKISFVMIYRQFYGKVQAIGMTVALLSLGMFGTSGGYYLLITKFGAEKITAAKPGEAAGKKITVKTDMESIKRGRELYESKCYFCHDGYSNKTEVGPGHKGILKNPLLPVSKRPATPENAANQIRNPYKDMPPFAYLAEGQVQDLIAFLNTL